MVLGRTTVVVAVVTLLAVCAGVAAWRMLRGATVASQGDLATSKAPSDRASVESPWNLLAGKETAQRPQCLSCHASTDVFDQARWNLLTSRSELDRQTW